MEIYVTDQETKRLQFSIATVTIIICSFAIFLTILYFIFNIKYRNFRLIKMSSPNINNIINFNCLLLYLCPMLNSIKGLYISNEILANAICQTNAWLIPVCSTALYAAMLVKAWRVFRIFDTTPKMKKVVIKDTRLIIYIIVMILIDVVLLLVWQFYDTIKLKTRYVYEIQQLNFNNITATNSYAKLGNNIASNLNANLTSNNDTQTNTAANLAFNINVNNNNDFDLTTSTLAYSYKLSNSQIKILYECNSSYYEVWVTVLTIYKIILLMYGIYLAWIIKNVNVPSMNDSKYLLLSTYTIIICGLGSMTLIQLLRDWPDVVQVFFTIGIVVATCTTQCLLFIPKIILWYKHRNDDNFKISLSQIFLQSSSSCYYSDKQGRNSANTTNANILNLEDELCELLHENSQLKNFLKEKEEIIKILQDKIRTTKANLYQINDKNNIKNEGSLNMIKTSEHSLNTQSSSMSMPNKLLLASDPNINSTLSTMGRQQQQQQYHETKINHHDSGYDIESTSNTIANDDASSVKNILISRKSKTFQYENENIKNNNNTNNNDSNMFKTERLKSDLDEVEELTCRVRDSISIDLSSTRRYSPLLYEYYRKQLELAKSIQSTYNIQCNTLFDAMTLMRKCLKDYCQSVHNPEYFAIDSFKSTKPNQNGIFLTKSSPVSNSANFLNFDSDNYNKSLHNTNQLPNLNISPSVVLSSNVNTANKQIKRILNSNTFTNRNNKNDSANNTFLASETTSSTSTSSTSPSASSTPSTNLNSSVQLEPKVSIDNKQTYV